MASRIGHQRRADSGAGEKEGRKAKAMTAATDTSAASRPDPTADPADLVLHLGAAGADDARRSGAKAGRLAQLTRAGFAVPRGSPRRATGPVKVIRSVADVARLKPGDVLVTSVTTPAWTPAFSIVEIGRAHV